MKRKQFGVKAKKPKSFLFKPIRANWRDFFKGLGKAVASGMVKQVDGAIGGLVDSLCALSLTTEPGELAYRLIHRSLARAIVDLVEDSRTRFASVENRQPDSLSETLEEELERMEFSFTQEFLDHPEQFEGLKVMMPLLVVWLQWQGLSGVEADSVGRRLPSYFVYALQEEWRSDLGVYRSLADVLDNKFSKAAERDWAWRRYAALLQKRTEEGVFDEAFGLRDIYIPLRGYYLAERKKSEGGESTIRLSRTGNRRLCVVDVRHELERWVRQNDPADALRVLSGGPGSGKSSLARICAADWAHDGKHVLFIPLHLIDASRDIVQQVGSCVESEFGYNPLDSKVAEPDLLIIFDGLDELSHQGKAAAETARGFVREIEKLLQMRNLHELRLRIILSGREVIVQESEGELRREGEVLTLLPYYVTALEYDGNLHDSAKLLNVDQRQQWWITFAKLTDRKWEGLPGELQRADLDDVTSQPLLNYLVAQSYARGRLDFSRGDINLNEIYEDLVQAVHKRGYEHSRRHASIPDLSLEDFSRVLEEVALASWHGDSRSTTVREIMQHCERSGIGSLIHKFTQGAEAGVTNLLAAFFFRRQGQRDSGDRTFVFTHKSFGEYLAARRFVRAMSEVSDERMRQKSRGFGGWDQKHALTKWTNACGPSAVTYELFCFIRAEVTLNSIELVSSWQDEFAELFRYSLSAGIPKEALSCQTFREDCVWGRNSTEALLVAVNSCANKTKRLAQICIDYPDGFGTWLRQVVPQRNSGESPIALKCLSYSDLSHQSLYGQDLYEADLTGSDLSGSYLRWAWLTGACLDGSNVRNVDFSRADLQGASFGGADISGASFGEARIDGTSFDKAILVRARFQDAIGLTKALSTEVSRQNRHAGRREKLRKRGGVA